MNVRALKARNVELGITAKDWQECLGLKTTAHTYNKINGKSPLTLEQAEKIQGLLQIEDKDFGYYFLGHERNGGVA